MSQDPSKLGKYDILATLGAGAMGVVYLGYDPAIDRKVAVKTIHKALLDGKQGPQLIARFRQEAVAAGRLSHPGIVAVYDYGEDAETAYIVMEYAPGEHLADHVARRRPGLPEIGHLMAQLLDALQYAHESGVVHRDVKPHNLIVSSLSGAPRLKITDFGIARLQSSNLTQHGATVGTPSYMAPEQYVGGDVDHRVDLFAAGVVLYELVTARLPFDGATIHEVAYKICQVESAPASSIAPGLPPALDAVLARALAKSKEARFASAREFALALSSVLPQGMIPALTTAPMPANAPPLAATAVRSIDGSIGAWSTETLRALEAALVPVMGPLAGALVRRSAARTSDPAQLAAALSGNADEAARPRLLVSLQKILGAPAPAAPAPPAAPAGTIGEQLRGFTREDLDRITQVLAGSVGPIAKIFVQKAAASAKSYRELCLRVSERLGTPEERARFLSQVGAG